MKRFLVDSMIQQAEARGETLLRADASEQVDAIFLALRDALERGAERVTIPYFGSFTRKFEPARRVRDPRNGDRVMTPARHRIKFKEARSK